MNTTVGFVPQVLAEFTINGSPAPPQYVTLFYAGLIGACFTAPWLASKVFAGERGTAVNALVYLIAGALVGFILTGLWYAACAVLPNGGDFFGLLIAIAGLVSMFWIPMRIYEIGFLRALGFVVASNILATIAMTGVWLTVVSLPFAGHL